MLNIKEIKQILLNEKVAARKKTTNGLIFNSKACKYLMSRGLIKEATFENVKIYLSNKYSELKPFIGLFKTGKEMFYCINNNSLEPPKCKYCNDYKTFNSAGYYNETCGNKECVKKAHIDYSLEHYGTESPTQNEKVKAKCLETNRKNHGGLHNSQTQEYKEKFKQTSIKKYGVDNPNKSQVVKDKIKQNNLKKYGKESYAQTEECKIKTNQTCREKYGVDWPGQAEITKENIINSNIKKYGVNSSLSSPIIREKSKQTLINKYGVDNPQKSEEIKEKTRKTNNIKYGKNSYMQTEEYKEKSRKTSYIKYGYSNPVKSPLVKEKIINTNIEKYGSPCYFQTKEFKEKAAKTNIEKYGVKHPMQNPEIIKNAIRDYTYKGIGFDSSWELAYYIWCEDHNIKIERAYEPFIYFDSKNKPHGYYPDFKLNGTFIEVKGGHLINEKRELIIPYKSAQGNEADDIRHHKTLLIRKLINKKELKILPQSFMKFLLKWVKNKYGKNYLKSFATKNQKENLYI